MRLSVIPFVVLLLSGLLSIESAFAAPKVPAPRRLPAPEHITPEARQQIKARMGQHATTMDNLMRAVVALDRPTIRVLSVRIADEEVVARTSGPKDKQPPPSLPLKFFAVQDDLAAAARLLAAAAVEGGDDKLLGERFAGVTRTCVGCHSTYLHDRPDSPTPTEPKPTPAEPKPAPAK